LLDVSPAAEKRKKKVGKSSDKGIKEVKKINQKE
jgi:hypothetical protein